MTRIIVAGGRDFNDYRYLCKCMDELIAGIADAVEIVSGRAKGADSLGEQYATERGLRNIVFKPDWKQYGKAAGVLRNQQMLHYAMEEYPILAAFWDGKSEGTRDMIDRARKAGVNVYVLHYEKQ